MKLNILLVSLFPALTLSSPSRIQKDESLGFTSIPFTRVDTTTHGDLITIQDRLDILQGHVDRAANKFSGSSTSQKLSSRGNNQQQLGDGPSDFYYYATILVGSPAVAFEVQLDTGSSDLILMSNPCYDECDDQTQLYRPQDSSTYVNLTRPFSIMYGTGGASGDLVMDVVSFAGYTLKQTFAALHHSNGIYHSESGVTGLLGLAWAAIAQSGATPFLQQLFNNGQLDAPMFAMAFARQENGIPSAGGFINVGGVDKSLFTGPITYTNSSFNHYWECPLQDISSNGVSTGLSSDSVLLDTGTSLIYIPQAAAAAFYSHIPGSSEVGNGIYQYPCSATINLGFKFSGVTWTVSDADFNLGPATDDLKYCYGGLGYFPGTTDLWILGDVFLKNVYAVYRFSPSSIGFAALANPNALTQGYIPVGNGTDIAHGANSTLARTTSTMKPSSTSTTSRSTTTASSTTTSTSLTTSTTTSTSSSKSSSTSSTSTRTTTSTTTSTTSTTTRSTTTTTSISTKTTTTTSSSTTSTTSSKSTTSTISSTTSSSTKSSSTSTTSSTTTSSSSPNTSSKSSSTLKATSTTSTTTSTTSTVAPTSTTLYNILIMRDSSIVEVGYLSKTENSFNVFGYTRVLANALTLKSPSSFNSSLPVNLVSTTRASSSSSSAGFNLGLALGSNGNTFAPWTNAYGFLSGTSNDDAIEYFNQPADYNLHGASIAASRIWMVGARTSRGYPLTLSFIDGSGGAVSCSHFFSYAINPVDSEVGVSCAPVGANTKWDYRVQLFLVPVQST